MNATTLALLVLAIALGGAMFGLLFRWARAFDWRPYCDRLPRALLATWSQSVPILVPTALVLVLAILARQLVPPYSTIDTALTLLTWFAGFAMFIGFAMFVETFGNQISVSPSPLSIVERQHAYDTGAFARPSQINAALQDQDENELTLEFDE